ncbi:alpha/beta hydrolase [Cellulophaga sp. Hel_I_12]|uniref:alpha/beta hydrolase n=1 Tax=Cellulophaga sp. Hel_I_12 TaxID=1249972 RepID=UPI000648F2BB|nr:alpha/beta hydrolase [Cellulophaga sp. Hel_I_12]
MKNIPLILIFVFASLMVVGQDIAIQTFGKTTDQPILFLHGGPGYNSVAFEKTTAAQLSENGFFVISYDRRGEGRSDQLKAAYTFEETFADILSIYAQLKLEKASLLGHSFGGIVATQFAEKHPDKIIDLWLVGAPISMQQTFKTIIASAKEIYTEKNDTVNLKYMTMLENMDSKSLEYSSYTFAHAMQNGFYSPKSPSAEARALYQLFSTDSELKSYASKMDYKVPMGFWKNEKYTSINLTESLQDLKNKNIAIYGLYGKEDGLYDTAQIDALKALIGSNNVLYADHCSHNFFIDQQKMFIDFLVKNTN